MSEHTQRSFAYVGLGAMGLPIALRFAQRLRSLAVADTSRERVEATLAAAGPSAVDDPEMVRSAQTVFLCLPSQEATSAVVMELLQGPAMERTFIDFGTHPPEFVGRMSRMCEAGSATFCDCPVFGTPSMAKQGELYFLFSGPGQACRDFSALVSALGYRVRYSGPTGTASTIKLLQNALGTANLAIAAEALRLCEASGIETRLFIDVVRECGGIGLSTVFDRFADDMAARRDSGEGRLRIAAKDSQAAADLAVSSNVTAPLLEQTARRFRRALEAGLGERQFTDIINLDPKPRAGAEVDGDA